MIGRSTVTPGPARRRRRRHHHRGRRRRRRRRRRGHQRPRGPRHDPGGRRRRRARRHGAGRRGRLQRGRRRRDRRASPSAAWTATGPILDGEFELENGIRVARRRRRRGREHDRAQLRAATASSGPASTATAARSSPPTATATTASTPSTPSTASSTHSYASGSPDAGFYIGQCYPCNAVIDDVISEYNGLGYSGTNSGGDLVHHELDRSASTGPASCPTAAATSSATRSASRRIVGNIVYTQQPDRHAGHRRRPAGHGQRHPRRRRAPEPDRQQLVRRPRPHRHRPRAVPRGGRQRRRSPTGEELDLPCAEARELPLADPAVDPAAAAVELGEQRGPRQRRQRLAASPTSASAPSAAITASLGNCFRDNEFDDHRPRCSSSSSPRATASRHRVTTSTAGAVDLGRPHGRRAAAAGRLPRPAHPAGAGGHGRSRGCAVRALRRARARRHRRHRGARRPRRIEPVLHPLDRRPGARRWASSPSPSGSRCCTSDSPEERGRRPRQEVLPLGPPGRGGPVRRRVLVQPLGARRPDRVPRRAGRVAPAPLLRRRAPPTPTAPRSRCGHRTTSCQTAARHRRRTGRRPSTSTARRWCPRSSTPTTGPARASTPPRCRRTRPGWPSCPATTPPPSPNRSTSSGGTAAPRPPCRRTRRRARARRGWPCA